MKQKNGWSPQPKDPVQSAIAVDCLLEHVMAITQAFSPSNCHTFYTQRPSHILRRLDVPLNGPPKQPARASQAAAACLENFRQYREMATREAHGFSSSRCSRAVATVGKWPAAAREFVFCVGGGQG